MQERLADPEVVIGSYILKERHYNNEKKRKEIFALIKCTMHQNVWKNWGIWRNMHWSALSLQYKSMHYLQPHGINLLDKVVLQHHIYSNQWCLSLQYSSIFSKSIVANEV